MNDLTPIYRIPTDNEPDAFDDDDCGMPSMEERLARSARNMAMLDALPPKPEPTAEQIAQAREKQDAALRELIAPLLSDDGLRALSKGQRQFGRSGL